MDLDINQIKGEKFLKIENVQEKSGKLIFYYREGNNKQCSRLPFIKKGENYVFNHGRFNINCNKSELINEINKNCFYYLTGAYKSYLKSERDKRHEVKTQELKARLTKELKQGDLVVRYGCTPHRSFRIIEVDSFSDYGVTGFYVKSNLDKTTEYTQLSWKYIKGKYGEV